MPLSTWYVPHSCRHERVLTAQIESLPMNGAQGGELQNVLSVSTAANNRYLLHFNSLASLTQWTAGIRLAMFEHSTLQEAYTGSLIAGKGRNLNSIKGIMERTRFAYGDWARVRFGAGTPWQRCWCVVSPPDDKEWAKAQKNQKKSSSAYERVKMPKGNIKFYDTRKVTKKTRPICTVSDAFAAYAIYPQSKPLVDQSTLVKLEGLMTDHRTAETTQEGFVFVMPEVHAAVSGFEMMLRWLFPVYDAFALYGRPTRLIADVLDQRGLMFAMPKDRRYGYLDILDVSALIHTHGSQGWSERQWRRELKKMTAERIASQVEDSSYAHRRPSQRRATASGRFAVRFGEGEQVHSTPTSRVHSPDPISPFGRVNRTGTALLGGDLPLPMHKRSVSDAAGARRLMDDEPSRRDSEGAGPHDEDTDYAPPPLPPHGGVPGRTHGPGSLARIESVAEIPTVGNLNQLSSQPPQQQHASPHLSPPEPVNTPPALTHQPHGRPTTQPYQAPELRRAHSDMDVETLRQMQDAVRPDGEAEFPDDETEAQARWSSDVQQRRQITVASHSSPASRNLVVPTDPSEGALSRQHSEPRPNKLSPIPGSPSVGDNVGQFAPLRRSVSYMEGVPEDSVTPPVEGPSLHSQRSIARKPLPAKSSTPGPPRPGAANERTMSADSIAASSVYSVSESWNGPVIDTDALDRVLNNGSRSNTMDTTESSEPDYASTISSTSKHVRPRVERARTGQLKTVGDPNLPTANFPSDGAGKFDTWSKDPNEPSAGVPAINFGPTPAFKPTARPGTGGTMTQDDWDRRASRSRSRDRLSATGFPTSPDDTRRHSYGGAPDTPSPGAGLAPDAYSTTPPEQPHRLSPGGTPGHRRSLTPEELVPHRAGMSQQPQHAVLRKSSALLAQERAPSANSTRQSRKLIKSPPIHRAASADWTNKAGRPSPPLRPHSQGPSPMLDSAAINLSAREQMQVSRATGSPLVDLPKGHSRPPPEEHQGLMGHIHARERDRAASKANRNSMAVQHAIAGRQQQQQQQQQQQMSEHQAYQAQLRAQQAHAQQLQAQQMAMHPQIASQRRQNPVAAPPTRPPQQWHGPPPPPHQQHVVYPPPMPPSHSYAPQAAPLPYASPPQPYGASFYAHQQQQQQQHQQPQPPPHSPQPGWRWQ